MALAAAEEQLKLIKGTHNVVLSAGPTQKAMSVGNVAGYRGFIEGLSRMLPNAVMSLQRL